MDQVAMLGRAVDEVTRLVDRLDDAVLSNATPCAEWKVRDLLNHLVAGGTIFARSAEGDSISDEELGQLMTTDQLGSDFKQAWKEASTRAVEAFARPGALEQTVRLPFGEMPGAVACTIAVFDVTTHACDLARATGNEIQDVELVETAIGVGQQMIGPAMRQPGVFDAEQPCASDASPTERLLAFAGRRL